MRRRGRIIGGLPLVFLALGAWSARFAHADVGGDLSVRVWQLDDGLPENGVVGVAQSPEGYLWIASATGVARFDGVRFENYDLTTMPGFGDFKVANLLPSHDGGVWLGTLQGPVIFLKPNWSPRIYSDKLLNYRVDSMVEDNQGTLWVGYHGGPICRIVAGKITAISSKHPLPAGSNTHLAIDRKGQLWLLRGLHLGTISNDQYTDLWTQPSLGQNHLAASRNGDLWVCIGMHLGKFNPTDGYREIGVIQSDSDRGQATPFEDQNGTLWIGTTDNGLFRFDGSGFERVPTPQAKIACLADDREGNLWVGTPVGLDRVQPRSIELEGPGEGIPFGTVGSICQDRDGQLWAITQDGTLLARKDERWTPATNVGLTEAAMCLAADPAGGLWIGTRSKSHLLFHWHNEQLTPIDTNANSRYRAMAALLVSHTGDLWMASMERERLQCLRGGKLIEYPLPPSVVRIDTMAEDAAGNIWVGARSGDLLKIDPKDHLTDQQPQGPRQYVHCLYPMPDGSLWLGYGGGGLGRIKGGRVSVITSAQGLFEDTISQIVADDRGWLWLGGNHGIFRIRLSELNDFMDGKLSRVQSFHFGMDQELPHLQARYDVSPCVLRSADGRLWMPMETALAVVHPERVQELRDPPPVYVERVLADDTTVALSGTLLPSATMPSGPLDSVVQLLPSYHRLEFDFTALSLSAPDNMHFRYRLEGFDEDWIDAAGPRLAVYPRLPAADYRFRVIASNGDGVWNEEGAQLHISVAPFLTQTWWFRSLALATFSTLLLLLARYVSFRRLRHRLAVLEQRAVLDRERARIARDIHDDLGCGLTKIVLLSELSLQDHAAPEKVGGRVKQIASTAKQQIKSLDETVWAINPRNDTVADLIDYIAHFAVESLRDAGVECHLDLPDDPPEWVVPSEVRHSLFLAVKEAINNALRHAQATDVWVTIAVSNGSMCIVIADNGRGFTRLPAELGQDGLRNMDRRMHDIGGLFHLDSAPGAGTRISLAYPLKFANHNAEARA
jgi:signal transduction histidine kinase/ligand-binding sensor domain-containing protein